VRNSLQVVKQTILRGYTCGVPGRTKKKVGGQRRRVGGRGLGNFKLQRILENCKTNFLSWWGGSANPHSLGLVILTKSFTHFLSTACVWGEHQRGQAGSGGTRGGTWHRRDDIGAYRQSLVSQGKGWGGREGLQMDKA